MGASLSTMLAGRSIYKDYLERYRVKVEGGFHVVYKATEAAVRFLAPPWSSLPYDLRDLLYFTK